MIATLRKGAASQVVSQIIPWRIPSRDDSLPLNNITNMYGANHMGTPCMYTENPQWIGIFANIYIYTRTHHTHIYIYINMYIYIYKYVYRQPSMKRASHSSAPSRPSWRLWESKGGARLQLPIGDDSQKGILKALAPGCTRMYWGSGAENGSKLSIFEIFCHTVCRPPSYQRSYNTMAA